MFLIASKMILCLIIAAILGAIIGILLCKMCPKCHGHCDCEKEKSQSSCCAHENTDDSVKTATFVGDVKEVKPEVSEEVVAEVETQKPAGINRDEVEPDDLKRIKGVGEKIEAALNELGVYTFKQISEWNRENVAWVDEYLVFKGRIDREEWIEQAKILAKGDETEFSKRYDS